MHYVLRVIFASMTLCGCCFAQNQGGQGQGQQGQQVGGIIINPDGVIGSAPARRINLALEQQRLKALAGRQLPSDMTQPSNLRMVSLVRLEQELRKAIDAEREIDIEFRYLAGITQLEYVFVVPETGDLIIAGPAEGFAAMEDGRVVGVETGRPTLSLDDLLVMLRLQSTRQTLGCSFDPDPSRLAKAQAWNRANNSPSTVAVARQRFYQMAEVLGNWNVTIFGLPDTSHAAITMVEADYQLKRLGLGLNRPGVRGFRSYLDMAGANQNTMRRWWLAPRYEVIERSEDGRTFHITGPRLQLLAQEELVDAQGMRSDAAFTEVSTEAYTKQFNKHMEELCRRIPAFAGVQNLFDMAVVAALIRKHDLTGAAGWQPSLLLDSNALVIEKYNAPVEVGSEVNVKTANSRLMIGQIGGGVTIVPDQVIRQMDVLPADDRPGIDVPDSAWWWD